MRSGGNRNSVTLSRMIKARFSRFVCPVATYVSYFSFTSCQCSGVLFLHDAQRSSIRAVADFEAITSPPPPKFIKCTDLDFTISPAIALIQCWQLVLFEFV